MIAWPSGRVRSRPPGKSLLRSRAINASSNSITYVMCAVFTFGIIYFGAQSPGAVAANFGRPNMSEGSELPGHDENIDRHRGAPKHLISQKGQRVDEMQEICRSRQTCKPQRPRLETHPRTTNCRPGPWHQSDGEGQ